MNQLQLDDKFYGMPLATSDKGNWFASCTAFNAEQLFKLREYCDKLPGGDGQIGGGAQGDLLYQTRSSKVSWLNPNGETRWAFDIMAAVAADLNAKFFGFDLQGFYPLQYTVYFGSRKKGNHYDWHTDEEGPTPRPARKLSLVLQLSRPLEYEGGELQLCGQGEHVAQKAEGLIYAFPSYVRHRVTPVTKGVRRTLVAWAVGAPFR